MKCSTEEDAPVVAYVSKMIAIPQRDLPRNKAKVLTAEEMRERGAAARAARLEGATVESLTTSLEQTSLSEPNDTEAKTEETLEKEVLIGVGRIYSGTVHVGQDIHIYGPKYSPENPGEHHSVITVAGLYLIMGRELVSLDSVPAGNIFGISGLEGKILKNGTMCSMDPGINLAGVNLGSTPIVRVALEPFWPGDLPKLVEGLKLLNQADSAVQVLLQDSGEHVILTAGELHLEVLLLGVRLT